MKIVDEDKLIQRIHVWKKAYKGRTVLCEDAADSMLEAIHFLPEEHMDLYTQLINALEKHPTDRMFTDGEEILCRSSSDANVVADVLSAVMDEAVNVSYYDPKEDERNDETNHYTGLWAVSIV